MWGFPQTAVISMSATIRVERYCFVWITIKIIETSVNWVVRLTVFFSSFAVQAQSWQPLWRVKLQMFLFFSCVLNPRGYKAHRISLHCNVCYSKRNNRGGARVRMLLLLAFPPRTMNHWLRAQMRNSQVDFIGIATRKNKFVQSRAYKTGGTRGTSYPGPRRYWVPGRWLSTHVKFFCNQAQNYECIS